MNYNEIIQELRELGEPEKVLFKKQKFGIVSNNALGIYQKDLNMLAKRIGKNNALAEQLFDSQIYEGRVMCSKIFSPKNLTSQHMEKWVKTFENWEICDSFCMGLFAKSSFAIPKAIEWSERKTEFEKRAGFAIIAAYTMADKKAQNDVYEQFLPLIIREATDDRIYVKKAVNWALRNIGKRNIDLNKQAINTAKQILRLESKTAKWIALNALEELTKDNVRMSDYPRDIYRPTPT